MKKSKEQLLEYLEEVNRLHAVLVGDPQVLHGKCQELFEMSANLYMAIKIVKGEL